MLDTLSTRGRCGADDQLGTLSSVTPLRTRAAALVREGVPVSCSPPVLERVSGSPVNPTAMF